MKIINSKFVLYSTLFVMSIFGQTEVAGEDGEEEVIKKVAETPEVVPITSSNDDKNFAPVFNAPITIYRRLI
jgi:hypothetical protein